MNLKKIIKSGLKNNMTNFWVISNKLLSEKKQINKSKKKANITEINSIKLLLVI